MEGRADLRKESHLAKQWSDRSDSDANEAGIVYLVHLLARRGCVGHCHLFEGRHRQLSMIAARE